MKGEQPVSEAPVLLVGKANDAHCAKAVEFLRRHFVNCTVVLGKRGDPLPAALESWNGAWLISYLSQWVLPARLLAKASEAAINIHPGPPEYPGIGCTNFAIYDGRTTFGVTCHHMEPSVDSGRIVAVARFPLFETDTVYSLTQRCYAHILSLFYKIGFTILRGDPLPESEETWQRKPFTRAELNALCRLAPDMPDDEIRRRVRAVTFPNAPGAYMDVAGMRFVYECPPG